MVFSAFARGLDKILDWSKLKAFAEDNFTVNKMMNYVENIVEKWEMLATSTFSFSCNVFKSLLVQGC